MFLKFHIFPIKKKNLKRLWLQIRMKNPSCFLTKIKTLFSLLIYCFLGSEKGFVSYMSVFLIKKIWVDSELGPVHKYTHFFITICSNKHMAILQSKAFMCLNKTIKSFMCCFLYLHCQICSSKLFMCLLFPPKALCAYFDQQRLYVLMKNKCTVIKTFRTLYSLLPPIFQLLTEFYV